MEKSTLLTLINQNNSQITSQVLEQPQPTPPLPQNPITSSPFYQYFSQHTTITPQLQDIEKKYNRKLQQAIKTGIEEGTVEVRRKKRKFKLQEPPQPTLQEQLSREQSKFLLKKQKVLENLNEVYKEQKDLLVRNRSMMRNSGIRNRSGFFQYKDDNWLKEIRKAIRKNRQFKSSLQKRDEEVRGNFQSYKQNEIRERQQQIKRLKEVNHKHMQKKVEVNKREKQIKEELTKNCQSLVKKVKPSKQIYQLFQEEQSQKLRRVESERILKLQEFKRRKHIDDWETVKEHQDRYLETLEERREQWIQQFNGLREQQRSRLKLYRGHYSDKAREQEQELRQQAEREGQRGAKVMQKIRTYNEYVYDKFKPKVPKRAANPEDNDQTTKRRPEQDRTEIRLKGLQYLNKVKQTVKSFRSLPPRQQKVVSSSSLPKIKPQTAYRDYLKEMPPQRRKEGEGDNLKSALTERRGRWAESALNIISRMQMTEYKKGDKPLISSVLNKIQLLKAMHEQVE